MPNKIKINTKLEADPPKAKPSKRENCGNVTFHCEVACVLCFNNDSVFGESLLSLRKGNNHIEMAGIEGESVKYDIYAAATACPVWTDREDPFEITIGS